MFKFPVLKNACVVLALLVPVMSGLNCSSCSEEIPSVRDLANTLANEFTDMLEFMGGTVVEGPPPASDAGGPRLDSFTAPLLAGAEESLPDGTVIGHDYEQWFPVLFRSTDDSANLEHVAGGIAYVQQANADDQADSYLRFPLLMREQDGAEHIFTFRAQVHRLAEMRRQLTSALRNLLPRDVPEGMAATDGNAYHIYIALFSQPPDGEEKVGNYLIWNLSTYPAEAGDNPIEMCTAQSAFQSMALVDTNLQKCDGDISVDLAFGDRPSEESPCGAWNRFASGYNTIMDTIIELAADPDYQERATVLYPAGTRFFLHGTITQAPLQIPPDCQLELAWCPRDESRCGVDADCPTVNHVCCDNLCRDTIISDNFCGSCDVQCSGPDECLDGACAQLACSLDSDFPMPGDICCYGNCFDSLTDNNHCGLCDNPCAATHECQSGVCVQQPQCILDDDCPLGGDICCDNICFDSLTDQNHCGVCDNTCSDSEQCAGGICTQMTQCVLDGDCPAQDDICCGNTCYDSQTDPNHCGYCDSPCLMTEECVDGVCTPLPQCTIDSDCPPPTDICCSGVCYESLVDHSHCGFCDNICAGTSLRILRQHLRRH
jgi:hypothetical protein